MQSRNISGNLRECNSQNELHQWFKYPYLDEPNTNYTAREKTITNIVQNNTRNKYRIPNGKYRFRNSRRTIKNDQQQSSCEWLRRTKTKCKKYTSFILLRRSVLSAFFVVVVVASITTWCLCFILVSLSVCVFVFVRFWSIAC